MRYPLPPPCRVAAAVLLACVGCGSLDANQANIAGGQGPIISIGSIGGASGGGQSGTPGGGGGAGGAACVPPGASAACSACEATKCTTNAWIYGCSIGTSAADCNQDGAVAFDGGNYDPLSDPLTPADNIDWYHLCYDSTDTVASGPMKGVKKSVLCPEIVDCIHQSGCNAADTANLPCYCGAGVTIDECSAAGFVPKGPCAELIAGGAESNQVLTIGNRAIDYFYAAGVALGLVSFCDYPVGTTPGTCQTECLGAGDGGTTSCTTAATDGGAPRDGGGSRPDAGGRQGGAGGSGGAGGAGGAGNGCTTTYSFADAAACASCETPIVSTDPAFCDPIQLTAQVNQDSDGNPVAEGFGPDTLATAAQRDAAFAIIHRVVALQCASDPSLHYRSSDEPGCETLALNPCIYSSLGCLLDLGQSNTDLAAGNFTSVPTYSALAEYEAAAVADLTAGPPEPDMAPGYGAPGGVPVGASNGAFGKYINEQGTHPSSAIGMADNVLFCALNAQCTACFNLTATTSCPTGAAGSNGAAGAAGAAGAGGSSAGTGGATGAGGSGSTGGGGSGGRGGAAGASGPMCPDLDGDGVPDCKQTLVQNPGFDSATTGWKAEPGTTASWTSLDGADNPSSGAVAVVNSDTNPADAPYGPTTAGAFQCLTASAGSCYQVDVQTSIPTGQATVAAGFVLDEHTTADCSQATATSFVSPQTSTVGAWQTISGTTTRIPLGVGSMAVRLVTVKPVSQASAEALFDNILVRVTACAAP